MQVVYTVLCTKDVMGSYPHTTPRGSYIILWETKSASVCLHFGLFSGRRWLLLPDIRCRFQAIGEATMTTWVGIKYGSRKSAFLVGIQGKYLIFF
jgi:hypothetical protein